GFSFVWLLHRSPPGRGFLDAQHEFGGDRRVQAKPARDEWRQVKYLEDTKPPNGGLVAPDQPEAPREPTGRHPALLAVGLIALAALAVATFWPLANSPEPAVAPATAAEAMARARQPAAAAGLASDAEEQPMRSPVPTRIKAPTAVEPSVEQPRAREV